MNADELIEQLGEAEITVGTLRIWIHKRQFPESEDFWDGNWVEATAHCSAEGAEVWVNGPIVHLSELKAWADDCEQMYETLSGQANLQCMEPYLDVQMNAEKAGQITMRVSITADNLHQKHQFEFAIDQTYLPAIVSGCCGVLQEFPIRRTSNG